MPLSIVHDIAATIMNWYVLIFEVLRQEATRYGKKTMRRLSCAQHGLGMNIGQETD